MKSKTQITLFASLSAVILLCIVGLFSRPTRAIAGPTDGGGPENVVVLCSSCSFPGLPQAGHLVLMDRRSGDIWAYSDDAIAGTARPTYMGKLSALGQPVTKKP